MSLFRRKPKDNVPEEIQEYYQAERRERVGIAWLLAGITLLATLLIATGLFFGGRWVYRRVANEDKQPETTATQTVEQPQTPAPSETPAQPAPTTPAPSSPTPSPSPTPEPSPAAGGDISRTGDAGIPRTGPMDTIGLFVGMTALGLLTHAIYTRRQALSR